MGGWSDEGIIQDSDPSSPVMCNSTHLTSFAVLVSAESGDNFQVKYSRLIKLQCVYMYVELILNNS